jgi:hypothetical protein
MNELTTIKAELPAKLCAGLTQTEKSYVTLYTGKKVSEIEENTIKPILRELVKKNWYTTSARLGENLSEELNAQANVWYDALMLTSRNTSIDEIKHACSLGCLKTFQDDKKYPINHSVQLWMEWLTIYQNQTERITAIKKYNANVSKSIKEQTPPTPEQLEAIFQQSMKDMETAFKRTGEIDNHAIKANYDGMWRRGMLKFVLDKSDEYLMEANHIVTERAELIKKTSINLVEHNDAKKLLYEIEISEDYHAQVKVEARRIALKHFLTNNHPTK